MFQWDIQHFTEILVWKVAIFEPLQHTQLFLLRWALMEESLQQQIVQKKLHTKRGSREKFHQIKGL